MLNLFAINIIDYVWLCCKPAKICNALKFNSSEDCRIKFISSSYKFYIVRPMSLGLALIVNV